MPPVVGMSEAVMPTRMTLSADAPDIGRMLRKAAIANHPKLGRHQDVLFPDTATPPVVQPREAAHHGEHGDFLSAMKSPCGEPFLLRLSVVQPSNLNSFPCRKIGASKNLQPFFDPQAAGG